MIKEDIRKELFSQQDLGYKEFQSKLTPTVDGQKFIGVRTPALRKLAKKYAKSPEISEFLSDLPHEYFDENQLHAFIISEGKDFETTIHSVSEFLPFVDNWATCDQMSVKCFKKNREKILPYLKLWISSGETYTVRFGIVNLMNLFLDDYYESKFLDWVASVESEEYYVNMARAWFFATALAKQYDETYALLESGKLDKWTHNKTIQKAVESFRVSEERKQVLRELKRS